MLRIPKCDKSIEIHDGLDVEITDGKITVRPQLINMYGQGAALGHGILSQVKSQAAIDFENQSQAARQYSGGVVNQQGRQ